MPSFHLSVLAVAVVAGLGASARAQLAMDWSTVDGGGGESSGATLELMGTVGQPDAGGELAGATLAMSGGYWVAFAPPICPVDFNCDGFVDFFDYDAFVLAYEGGALPPCQSSTDINGDGFLDFFDYDLFVEVYETGC